MFYPSANMNSKFFLPLIVAATVAASLPAMAQRARVSPHETISSVISGNRVTLVYGRPYSKDPKSGEIRKIWGSLIPYGKVWRTGSDEATLLLTEKNIMLGDAEIPAGVYSLHTFPSEDGSAKLIVNKRIGQWGIPYNEKGEAANELARIDLKKETLDNSVDQFTMSIDKNPSGGGMIKMMWEKTAYSVAYTVKK